MQSAVGIVVLVGCRICSRQRPATDPPFGARVTDLTGTLDAQQKQALETQLEALEKSKGSRVAILMLPTTAPEDIAQYSIRVTDAWKLAQRRQDA
jgi:uncharacterized protein